MLELFSRILIKFYRFDCYRIKMQRKTAVSFNEPARNVEYMITSWIKHSFLQHTYIFISNSNSAQKDNLETSAVFVKIESVKYLDHNVYEWCEHSANHK